MVAKIYKTADYDRKKINSLRKQVSKFKDAYFELKKVKDKLEQSESKYRLLAENISDVVVVQDLNLNIEYISPSVEELTGYTVREIMNKDVKEIMTEESYRRAVESFNQAKKMIKKGVKNVDIPLFRFDYIKKNGQIITGELKSNFIKNDQGEITATVVVVRDMTERKKIEEKLKRSKEKYRKFFESAPDAVLLVDAKGKIKECSRETEQLYGRAKKDIIGHAISEFMTESSLKQFKRDFKKTSGVVSVEGLKIIRPGGEEVEVWRKSYPFFDKRGELGEIIMYDRDISDYMQMVREVRKANESLEKKMEELEKINNFMVGRELKMIELKDENKKLRKKLREK